MVSHSQPVQVDRTWAWSLHPVRVSSYVPRSEMPRISHPILHGVRGILCPVRRAVHCLRRSIFRFFPRVVDLFAILQWNHVVVGPTGTYSRNSAYGDHCRGSGLLWKHGNCADTRDGRHRHFCGGSSHSQIGYRATYGHSLSNKFFYPTSGRFDILRGSLHRRSLRPFQGLLDVFLAWWFTVGRGRAGGAPAISKVGGRGAKIRSGVAIYVLIGATIGHCGT